MDAQEDVDQSSHPYCDSEIKPFQLSKNFKALMVKSMINTERTVFFSSPYTTLIKSRPYFCVELQFFIFLITLS